MSGAGDSAPSVDDDRIEARQRGKASLCRLRTKNVGTHLRRKMRYPLGDGDVQRNLGADGGTLDERRRGSRTVVLW